MASGGIDGHTTQRPLGSWCPTPPLRGCGYITPSTYPGRDNALQRRAPGEAPSEWAALGHDTAGGVHVRDGTRCGPQGQHVRPSDVSRAQPRRPQWMGTRPLGHQQSSCDGVCAYIAFRVQVRYHGG